MWPRGQAADWVDRGIAASVVTGPFALAACRGHLSPTLSHGVLGRSPLTGAENDAVDEHSAALAPPVVLVVETVSMRELVHEDADLAVGGPGGDGDPLSAGSHQPSGRCSGNSRISTL